MGKEGVLYNSQGRYDEKPDLSWSNSESERPEKLSAFGDSIKACQNIFFRYRVSMYTDAWSFSILFLGGRFGMLLLIFLITQTPLRKSSTAQAMYGNHRAFVQIDKPSNACQLSAWPEAWPQACQGIV